MVMAAAAMTAAGTCGLSVLNTGTALKYSVSVPSHSFSLNKLSPSAPPSLLRKQERFFRLRPCLVAQSTELEENREAKGYQEWEADSIPQEESNQRKLFVLNLPWRYPASDLENLFGQYGSVNYVEMIKLRDGRSRGFAFVTMASPEEAQAAIEKLNSFELAGRIITVQLAKSFRKPSTKQQQTSTPKGETRHKVYVGNLHWKARAGNLREFFSAKFKPLTARVIFDNSSGKSAGYGFVSFDTKEEMEAAVSELDGAELMGRPLKLRIGQKNSDESHTIQDGSTQSHSEGS